MCFSHSPIQVFLKPGGSMLNRLATLAIALAFIGCTTAEDTTPESGTDGFTLLQHDEATIDAVYESAGASLHFLATETEPRVIDLTFDFGDAIIAFRIDHNQGAGDFMPNGQPLDAAQRRVAELMAGAIAELVDPNAETRSTLEDTAYRQATFVLEIPTGEALVQGSFHSARGWTHISTSCYNQYIGSGYYRVCGKGCSCTTGSTGCRGRCGQGCGGTSTPKCYGSTAYTRDCAKHDYGVGSWWAASDDFSFASNNASCGGNCY